MLDNAKCYGENHTGKKGYRESRAGAGGEFFNWWLFIFMPFPKKYFKI